MMTKMLHLLRHLTRPAYQVQGIGLGRLCESVRRHAAKIAPKTALRIDDFRGASKFNCYLHEHMGGQIFFRGSYSGDQLDLLENILPADGVFIDVGANQGEFSIAAAAVAKEGKVVAFEPVSRFRRKLSDNILLNNFAHVEVVSCALGEDEGSFPLYDQEGEFYDGTYHEGLPSLFASESRKAPCEVVAVRRLDDVLVGFDITQVHVIKLDIEGAEWAALRGAEQTLARYRPTLIVEIGRETCQAAGYEPEEFARWIIAQGYRLEKVIRSGKTKPITAEDLGDFQNIVAWPSKEQA